MSQVLYLALTRVQFGCLICCLEWITFVCNHTLSDQWKSIKMHEPWIVKKVFANSKTCVTKLLLLAVNCEIK